MQLSQDEIKYLSKISAISGYNFDTVKNVLQSLLSLVTIEMLLNFNSVEDKGICKIKLPYLDALQIDYSDIVDKSKRDIVVDSKYTPSKLIMKELKSIFKGNLPETGVELLSKIDNTFKNTLEITK